MGTLKWITLNTLLMIALCMASSVGLAEEPSEASTYIHRNVVLGAAGGAPVVPLAWSCGPWSAWQAVAYYCVGYATCADGCPVRAKLLYRAQTCSDEQGNSFLNEEQKEVFSGCCTGGPGGQCPSPLKVPQLASRHALGVKQ